MPRSLSVATSALNAPWRVDPLGGNESSEVGTQLLPVVLAGEESALTAESRFWIARRHGAGGVEQIAQGEETLSGGSSPIDLDLAKNAALEDGLVGDHASNRSRV